MNYIVEVNNTAVRIVQHTTIDGVTRSYKDDYKVPYRRKQLFIAKIF